MINSLLSLVYAGAVFAIALLSITKFRKLIPSLLILVFASTPFHASEIIFASSVTGLVVGYFMNALKVKVGHALIPLTLTSLGAVTAVSYQTNSGYLLTLFTGLGASAGLGIAYSMLSLSSSNIPRALRALTSFRVSINPQAVANYLTLSILSAAVTLLASETFGRSYALITGFLTSVGIYAYFKVFNNRYALLAAYLSGAALTWLALKNTDIQSLNGWIKFINEVIFTWERNAL